MREVLFRGKRYNGKWVKGYYFKAKQRVDRTTLCAYISVPHPKLKMIPSDDYMVDPDTVSEFTGLCDKKGTKIFEGDLLKIISWVMGAKAEGEKRQDIAEVQYNGNTGGFKLRVYHDGKYKRISKFSAGHLCAYDAEVIGNKWDNPELLEGNV